MKLKIIVSKIKIKVRAGAFCENPEERKITRFVSEKFWQRTIFGPWSENDKKMRHLLVFVRKCFFFQLQMLVLNFKTEI